jgi:DNA-binding transcriptional regulator YiaG
MYAYFMNGKELKAMREHLGLSQSQLGYLIGVKHPQSMISRWERRSFPVPDYAEKVCRYICTGDGEAEAMNVIYGEHEQ